MIPFPQKSSYSFLVLLSPFVSIFGLSDNVIKEKGHFNETILRVPHWTSKASLRCGEILNCTSNGIFYKPFETVLEDERCVWIVAVPNARSYSVNIRYLGFQPEERFLTIAGFKRHVTNVTYNVPSKVGEFIMENSNVLVITFHSQKNSGHTNSTGFLLQYKGLQRGKVVTSNVFSRQEIIGPDSLYSRHPPSKDDKYLNNELSFFAFPPPNNIFKKDAKRNIVYKRISLESCWDKLSIFMFNPHSNQWNLMGSICDDTDAELMSGNDIILVVFHSDPSTTAEGFELISTSC